MTVNGSTFNYDYLEAKPFTNYTVTMRAKTYAGWGNYSHPRIFSTKYAGIFRICASHFHTNEIGSKQTRIDNNVLYPVPGKVSKVSCNIEENPRDRNILDTTIKWGMPCCLNGKLDFFNITIYGTRDKFNPDVFHIKDKCVKPDNYMCSVKLRELKGEYNYNVTISVKIKNLDTLGPISVDNILYPAGSMYKLKNSFIMHTHTHRVFLNLLNIK